MDPVRLVEIAPGRLALAGRGEHDALAADVHRAGRDEEVQRIRGGVAPMGYSRPADLQWTDREAVVGCAAWSDLVQRVRRDPAVDDFLQRVQVAVQEDTS